MQNVPFESFHLNSLGIPDLKVLYAKLGILVPKALDG